MHREAPAYLRDVIGACDAIVSVLSGVEFEEYHATRMLRSSVEREFTIIGEAIAVLSRTEPQLFARITNGRRIELNDCRDGGLPRADSGVEPDDPAGCRSRRSGQADEGG